MLRQFALVALVALGPRFAGAQDPSALADKRLAGTWKLDRANSDTVPSGLRVLVTNGVPARGTINTNAGPIMTIGGTPMAGGGTIVALPPGSSGAGIGIISPGSSRPMGAAAPRAARGAQPHAPNEEQVAMFMAELAPPSITFTVEQEKTVIVAKAEEPVTWMTDKKKHVDTPDALSALESSWWLKTLQTIRTIDNGSTLQRDIKVSKDGKTLEVKVSTKAGGKKGELKLKYLKVD